MRSGAELLLSVATTIYSDPGLQWKITRVEGGCGCCGGGAEVDYATNLAPNDCVVDFPVPFDGDGNGTADDYTLVSLPVDDGATYYLYKYVTAPGCGCCGSGWYVYAAAFSPGHATAGNSLRRFLPAGPGDALGSTGELQKYAAGYDSYGYGAGRRASGGVGHILILSDDYRLLYDGAYPGGGSGIAGSDTEVFAYAGAATFEIEQLDGTGSGRYELRPSLPAGDYHMGVRAVEFPAAPTLDNITSDSIRVTIPSPFPTWATTEEIAYSIGRSTVDLYKSIDGGATFSLHTANVTAGQVITDTGLNPEAEYQYRLRLKGIYASVLTNYVFGEVASETTSAPEGGGGSDYLAEGALEGDGSLSGDASIKKGANASLEGDGSLSGAARRIRSVSGALEGDGSLSGDGGASGSTVIKASGALELSGDLSGDGAVDDGVRCCEEGFYFNPVSGECEPIPPEWFGAIPAVPDAPEVAKDCETATITITAPDWDLVEGEATLTMKLQGRANGGVWRDLHTWEDAGGVFDHVPEGLERFADWEYRAAGCNHAGCSNWSEISDVITLRAAIALEFRNPDDGATLARKQTFVIRATLEDGEELADDAPLVVTYQGAPLTGLKQTYHVGNVYEWSLVLDTASFAYQGAFKLVAQAKNAQGCQTAPLEGNWILNNDLFTATRWYDDLINAPEGGAAKTLIVAGALLGTDAPASSARWYEIGVSAPPPEGFAVGLPDSYYENEEAREADWSNLFTPWNLNKETGLLSRVEGDNVIPIGNSVLVRLRIRPKEVKYQFALNAANVVALRPLAADRVEVITANPCKIFWLDSDGITLKYDLTDFGAEDALDARLVGDKIIAAMPDHIKLIDTDASDATLRLVIDGEAGTPKRVERSGTGAIVFYGAAGTHSAYKIEKDQLKKIYGPLAEDFVLSNQRGDLVAVVSRDDDGDYLREIQNGEDPGDPIVSHNEHISAVMLSGDATAFAFQIADETGAIYEPGATAGTLRLVATMDFRPLALGQFKGSASYIRRAVGGEPDAGDNSRLWLEVEQGEPDPTTWLYAPRLSVEDLAKVVGLERYAVTLVAGAENPLNGAPPAVTSDFLVAAIEPDGENAYLLRLEEATYSAGFSYGGTGISRLASRVIKYSAPTA